MIFVGIGLACVTLAVEYWWYKYRKPSVITTQSSFRRDPMNKSDWSTKQLRDQKLFKGLAADFPGLQNRHPFHTIDRYSMLFCSLYSIEKLRWSYKQIDFECSTEISVALGPKFVGKILFLFKFSENWYLKPELMHKTILRTILKTRPLFWPIFFFIKF